MHKIALQFLISIQIQLKDITKGQNKLPVYSVVAGKRPHWLQNGWKGIMFSVERGEVQDNFRCTTMSP